MNQSLEKLEKQFFRIAQLDHASTFLSSSLAELASMRHELMTQDSMGEWLADASEALSTGEINAGLKHHIREMKRTWQQSMAMPAELVSAKVLAGSRCEHGWRTQKGQNDWSGFLANFKEVVTLSREEAQARQAQEPERFATPYDALLDLHCSGDSQSLISQIFSELKETLPELLQQVVEHQSGRQTKDLTGSYPIVSQRALSEYLMSMFGFDFNAGRLDVSMHPFSTGGQGDQRITTRYRDTDFIDALQATAHETGHASYEAGLPADKSVFPVGSSRNMCIHESQSLMFEKQLFLSRSFGKALIDPLHRFLPSTQEFTAEDIWYAQTRVRPSFIRVEADEVTYPLHVMLRFDIESALINGDIEADVIPDAWEDSLNKYLGLSTGGDHAKGCLQDIHWTDGAFGYFPSYTMGAVNAAQLSSAMKRDCPDWQAQLAAGDLEFARTWLSDAIWQHGCKLESQELMTRATGEGSSAKYLIEHLKSRYLSELD